jgi:hypothetical protein
VDFAIQDLLKGRRIGVYQDLAPGGDQFLSRSRVHTPPGKGKQRIVHALCSLNEPTVKRQTTYEDLRMIKSVVKSQDFMLSLDVESAFFHVPIHPKHRKFFSSHLALPLFVKNKFIELQSGGYFVCSNPDLARSGFGALGSNASAPAPPLSSSRRVQPCGVAARLDQLDQDLDERHVRYNSRSSPPRHSHAVVCRRLVDHLLLLRGSFKGATYYRGHDPRRVIEDTLLAAARSVSSICRALEASSKEEQAINKS